MATVGVRSPRSSPHCPLAARMVAELGAKSWYEIQTWAWDILQPPPMPGWCSSCPGGRFCLPAAQNHIFLGPLLHLPSPPCSAASLPPPDSNRGELGFVSTVSQRMPIVVPRVQMAGGRFSPWQIGCPIRPHAPWPLMPRDPCPQASYLTYPLALRCSPYNVLLT